MSKFDDFAALHVAGDPVVLFNIWDPGSAIAVAKSGAKALATGSASVSMATGVGDGRKFRSTSRSPTLNGSPRLSIFR